MRMAKPTHRCTVLVYRGIPGSYGIVCRDCGECYGGSESADAKYLAALNRNRRPKKKRAVAGRKRKNA